MAISTAGINTSETSAQRRARQGAGRATIANTVSEGITPIPTVPVMDSPAVNEQVPPIRDYKDYAQQEIRKRGLTAPEAQDINADQDFIKYQGSEEPQFTYGGASASGQPQFKPVQEDDFNAAAEGLALPDPAPITDVGLFESTPGSLYENDTYAGLSTDQADSVFDIMEKMEEFTKGKMESNPEFNAVINRTGIKSMADFASISALANAGILSAQASYVAGKSFSAEAAAFEEEGGQMSPDVKDQPAQLGVTANGYIKAAQGRFKQLMGRAGYGRGNLSERDFQVIGAAMFDQSLDSRQIVTTKIGGKRFYVPSGQHTGTLLGNQSDLMVGADLQNGVSRIPGAGGNAIYRGKAVNPTRKKQGDNQIAQDTVVLAKDTMGHMAYGMDKEVTTAIIVQVMDVLEKMTTPDELNQQGTGPVDPENLLMYSNSKFAPMFKLDQATAQASYRTKYFNSKNKGQAQKEGLAQAVNRITMTRQDEILVNLNKQLKLIKEGNFAGANEAFYYSFGSSDINGRIANASHNGNYTLDKVVARQTQKAKINPRLNVTKDNWESRNSKLDATAESLLKNEGNPLAFNKSLNAMDASLEAEISFRICLVKTLLKDAKHAAKKSGKDGVSSLSKAESNAISMAQETGMLGRRNHSNKALYEAYTRMNPKSNPRRLMSYYAAQGKEIKESLNILGRDIEDLSVIEFDPSERASEKTRKVLAAWGSISLGKTDALEIYANERGETRANMSIRDNAFKYMQAYNGEPGSSSNFELDFEIELDATQSGAFLQALIAPTASSRNVLDRLGFSQNTTDKDLRDVALDSLLNGSTIRKMKLSPELESGWASLVKTAFEGEQNGIARELMLKQPIMQFFYGKPASMFGDVASEFVGWFREDFANNPAFKDMSDADRVEGTRLIIENVLSSSSFDAQYAKIMKQVGQFLAVSDSDLVIRGPMGDINLTIESVVTSMRETGALSESTGANELEIDMLDILDRDQNENIQYRFTNKSTTTGSPKQGRTYNPTEPESGSNLRSGPGKRLKDSMGVLIIHQLDNALMNHTVNTVNKDRPRENPYPAKIIYDAIIPNAAGYLRYSHAYNNESIPLAQNWDVYAELQRVVGNAVEKTKKDIGNSGVVNISVLEDADGNVRGVERFAVITQWLDDYEITKPRVGNPDYVGTDGAFNKILFNRDMDKYRVDNANKRAIFNTAKKEGYIPPILNEQYLLYGVVPEGQPLVLNAKERANMFVNKAAYLGWFTRFKSSLITQLDVASSKASKERAKLKNLAGISHLN